MSVSSQRRRITGALLMAGIVATIGYCLGEFAPFTGGFASIAEPFSPVRDETAYGYAVVGAFLGAIAGLATSGQAQAERRCPQCAETILSLATKCKHCGSDVIPSDISSAAPRDAPTAESSHPNAVVTERPKKNQFPFSSSPSLRFAVPILFATFLVVVVLLVSRLGKPAPSQIARADAQRPTSDQGLRPLASDVGARTAAVSGDFVNGRFAKSNGGDTIAFIDGWFTIIENGDSITAQRSDSDVKHGLDDATARNQAQGLAALATSTPYAPFDAVSPPSPNADGTVTVARQRITKNPLCRSIQTSQDQWSCIVTGNSMIAQMFRARGIVTLLFAKDADGYFIPAQPMTNMERIRLSPVR